MFPQEKLFRDIPSLFEQYPKDNFRFVHGTATKLEHTDRFVSVTLATDVVEKVEKLDFYALIIATGASTPSPLLGLNQDAKALRAAWVSFREALPAAKSIVIAGGGPAGIETAGELGEYLNGRAGRFSSNLENPKVSITVVTAASQILPALRPALAHKAEQLLAKVGVTVTKNTRVASVTPAGAGTEEVQAKATISLDDGKTLEADLYIPAIGTTPNTGFIDKSLLSDKWLCEY